MLFTILLITFISGLYAHYPAKRISGQVLSADDGSQLPGVNVVVKGTAIGTVTDTDGKFELDVPDPENAILVFSFIGLKTREIKLKNKSSLVIRMESDVVRLEEVVVSGYAAKVKKHQLSNAVSDIHVNGYRLSQPLDTEEYSPIEEGGYHGTTDKPLSTFSIDVDAASYANVRRFLNNGEKPPADAVRIEEMINYFSYDYPEPEGKDPFSIYTEVSDAPWNSKHKLVHIGLQGKKIPVDNLPASNLVFLLDVSGSMSAPNKLPLLKKAFRMLTDKLRSSDKVSIVVYAGAAGVVLEPTSGKDKGKILEALDKLQAGGSTAGGAGIRKAYDLAEEEFIKGGNNRVILATDGDFNVGVSSPEALEDLITQKRASNIFLTVLGFGSGNLKDNKMETLANSGNGNYAYIDNIQEARKVLISEFGGTLYTIAKDVKIQVEFNPRNIQAYRLIGYENRLLNDEDFNNDKKDAGELGSGHTVTALYEIIPTGVKSNFYNVDPLKYQPEAKQGTGDYTKELLTVKLRYKAPDENKSERISRIVEDNGVNMNRTTDDYRWSSAVAAFGMWLRNSEYLNEYSLEEIGELAAGALGEDSEGYRRELLRLLKSQARL
ncbi:MAG: von Willebrand factor type A domain-containing protein [Cyclobacteriaceae bacterium]